MKKILIEILGCKHHYFNEIENSIKNTWLNHLTDTQEYLFFYGSNNKTNIYEKNELYCCVNENPLVLHKTFEAFKWALDNIQFDYIFRPCNGSFIVPSLLQKHIEKLPNIEVFNGIIGNFKQTNTKFISGAGMILSRDIVNKFITFYNENGINKIKEITPYQDDVSLGIISNLLDIELTQSSRVDINELNIINDKNFINANKNIEYHYHFRNKPEIMYSLYKELFK